jgi:hypothetical protein
MYTVLFRVIFSSPVLKKTLRNKAELGEQGRRGIFAVKVQNHRRLGLK